MYVDWVKLEGLGKVVVVLLKHLFYNFLIFLSYLLIFRKYFYLFRDLLFMYIINVPLCSAIEWWRGSLSSITTDFPFSIRVIKLFIEFKYGFYAHYRYKSRCLLLYNSLLWIKGPRVGEYWSSLVFDFRDKYQGYRFQKNY